MSLLVLSNLEDQPTGTRKMVYSRSEVEALNEPLQQFAQLGKHCTQQQQQLADATDESYRAGFEEGREAGHEKALEQLATRLVILSKEANAASEGIERSAASLAIQIVRKIAPKLGTENLLAALAQQAARELVPAEYIVIKVNPSQVVNIEQALSEMGNDIRATITFEGDPSLPEDGCILETEFGHVNADLETQLQALRRQITA